MDLRLRAALVAAALPLAACGGEDDDAGASESADDDFAAFQRNYADLVHANHADALETARALRTAVDGFVAAPSPAIWPPAVKRSR